MSDITNETADRLDAARYRWLRQERPDALCSIAFIYPAACEVEPLNSQSTAEHTDAVIDAARLADPSTRLRRIDGL